MPLIPPVTIPIPPSANVLWKHGKGRTFKDAKYSQWIEQTSWLLARDLPHVKGARVGVEVHIYGGRGFSKARDVDNCQKAILDCLQRAGVIENDNVQHVKWVRVEYFDPESRKAEATCEVGIEIL